MGWGFWRRAMAAVRPAMPAPMMAMLRVGVGVGVDIVVWG